MQKNVLTSWLRRMTATASILLCLLIVSGCCVGQVDVVAIEPAIDVIVPEYEAYLTADTNLSAGDKATRARTIELLRKLLSEAKAGGTQ